MTVGVPVTVQPGTVTELYPDKDGSPSSAPGLTSRFGLSTMSALACGGLRPVSVLCPVCSILSRTHANRVHSIGVWTGVSGLAVIDGPAPAHPNTSERMLETMFSGVNGPLNRGGSACGVTVSVVVAAKAVRDEFAAGAARVNVRRSGLDVVSVNRRAVGDGSVDALLFRFTLGIGDAEEGNEPVVMTSWLHGSHRLSVSAACVIEESSWSRRRCP